MDQRAKHQELKIWKLLEENRENFIIRFHNVFLDMIAKAYTTEESTDKLDLIKN